MAEESFYDSDSEFETEFETLKHFDEDEELDKDLIDFPKDF